MRQPDAAVTHRLLPPQPLMSVEQYVQCIARADRKGQDSDKVTVIHIQGSPIEKKMFKALEDKVSDNSLLTEMFDTEINS